jgi:hypothetical protein
MVWSGKLASLESHLYSIAQGKRTVLPGPLWRWVKHEEVGSRLKDLPGLQWHEVSKILGSTCGSQIQFLQEPLIKVKLLEKLYLSRGHRPRSVVSIDSFLFFILWVFGFLFISGLQFQSIFTNTLKNFLQQTGVSDSLLPEGGNLGAGQGCNMNVFCVAS